MNPMVKTNSSIPEDDVTIHNSTLKSDTDFCYPLSSRCHDSLYHDHLDQSDPPISFSQSLDFRVASRTCDQVQGTHIMQVEEQEGEYYFILSSLFQNPRCQDGSLTFFDDFQYSNLVSE